MAEPVTSPRNARLKLVRKLGSRRGREKEGAFTAEGEDLVHAGIHARWPCRFVLVTDEARLDIPPGISLVPVEESLSALSNLAWPPNAIGVFDLPSEQQRRERLRRVASESGAGPVVYLDGLADPGNVGTILRSAGALGASGVALGPQTADAFAPKSVRSSMGAVFTTPHASITAHDLGNRPLLVLDPHAGSTLWDVEIPDDAVICIGDERQGVTVDVRRRADIVARIPQTEDVDSLNAGAAAALALYEWRRQRSHRGVEL